uniref:Uncharacterized protein n=3 Tax=Brassica TaxID=3705 RepID=A0A0D2ZQS6_BRAOL
MKKPSVTSFLITLLLSAAVCAHGTAEINETPVKVGEKYFMLPVKTENNDGGRGVPWHS